MMANLRAGFRFELAGFCASERLGAACRRAYGFINHHGYLMNGLRQDFELKGVPIRFSLRGGKNPFDKDR